jgi:hypothetical protein
MFRKMILTALLAAGTITGMALTPATAEASPRWGNHARHASHYRHNIRHSRFEVLYLDCGQWKCYGTYGERCDADGAALQLRHRGFEVRIGGC